MEFNVGNIYVYLLTTTWSSCQIDRYRILLRLAAEVKI